jgi:hypothetical protein
MTMTATATCIYVPTVEDFGAEDFLPAADLCGLLADLVQEYPNTIGHINMLDVPILWKKAGGKSKGKATFGKCQKPSGLLSYFSKADFVIVLGADHVRDDAFTDAQIRALVYHEALHIGWEDGEDGEDGHAILVGHDVEMFTAEVRDMGAWHHMLSAAASSFSQAGLFG